MADIGGGDTVAPDLIAGGDIQRQEQVPFAIGKQRDGKTAGDGDPRISGSECALPENRQKAISGLGRRYCGSLRGGLAGERGE